MHENVSSAEAKQYGLDRKLKTFLGQGKSLPLEIAIRRLLASWAASQLALLLHLLIFTLKWLGVYVPSTILVLIGILSAVKHNKAESRWNETESMLFARCRAFRIFVLRGIMVSRASHTTSGVFYLYSPHLLYFTAHSNWSLVVRHRDAKTLSRQTLICFPRHSKHSKDTHFLRN